MAALRDDCVRCAAVKPFALIVALCLALGLAACGGGSDSTSSSTEAATTEAAGAAEAGAEKTKPKVTVPKGAPPKKLVIKEIEEGTGAEAKAGTKSPSSTSGSTTRAARNSMPPGIAANRSASNSAPAW